MSPLGDDFVRACGRAPSGDIYVAGTGFNGLDSDAVLMKFTGAGAFAWMRSVSGAGGSSEYTALDFDALGNVIVTGWSFHASTRRDALLQSYTPAGALNWSTEIDGGGGGHDSGWALRVLQSGEIVVAGTLRSTTGRGDFAVWKFDANGSVVWTRALDGGSNLFDVALHIAVSPSGKVLAGGSRAASTNNGDWMLAQLDLASGDVDWTAYHDAAGLWGEWVWGIGIDAAGVWWVTGITHPVLHHRGVLTQRYSATGAVLSSSSWFPSSYLWGLNLPLGALMIGSAGQAWVGVNVLGPTSSWIVMLEFDTSGAPVLEDTFGGSFATQYVVREMTLAPDDRVVFAGSCVQSPNSTWDLFTLQLDLSHLPAGYCEAKTTSIGCVPFVTFTGSPSASSSSDFAVRANSMRNQKNGLLLYGLNGAATVPFQGGTMCIAAPQLRTPMQSSGGSPSPADDCSGSLALDMNAFASGALGGNPSPALSVAGTTVCCQFWGRDPGFAPPQNTMLSSALSYVVLP
jgi:hypothetical protein